MFEKKKKQDGSWMAPGSTTGAMWQSMMRKSYPDEYQLLIAKDLLFPITYQIDERASELYGILIDGYKARGEQPKIHEIRSAIHKALFKPHTELLYSI